MAGLQVPLPTLRRRPHGRQRTAWGRCGSLHLHRSGLSPPTPCRSPGAHQKTSLNVHAHRGMHKHSTRCVHQRTTTPEILLHPCTRAVTRTTEHSEKTKRARSHPRWPWHVCQTAHGRVPRQFGNGCTRFGHAECSVHPSFDARARMEQHFWCGSPQVNTPCRMLLHAPVSMNVQRRFWFLLASTKRDSPAGARPGTARVLNN
jgi:hypothetical protein